MKILVVCNDYDYFVHHRISVFEDLARDGHRVIVYSGGRAADAARHPELEFRHIHCERFRFSPRKDFGLLRQVYSALRRERPDVVQTVTIKPNLFAGLAARFYGLFSQRELRLVMMNPGLGRVFAEADANWRSRLTATLTKIGFKIVLSSPASHVVFENHGDRRRWVEARLVPRIRTHVLRGAGIDPAWFAPHEDRAEPPPMRILFAARLLRAKGIESFMEAARILTAEGARAEFIVAGDADEHDPGHYPLDAVRKTNAVRFVGHQADIRKVLGEAHVVCLPTFYGEGLPRILLEGAAMRCALVASDVPGCKAIVRDMVTGRLVPLSGGRVDGARLADILRWMIAHPDRVKEFAGNARDLLLRGGFDRASVNGRFKEIILGSA